MSWSEKSLARDCELSVLQDAIDVRGIMVIFLGGVTNVPLV
jgi:hypothetical protein